MTPWEALFRAKDLISMDIALFAKPPQPSNAMLALLALLISMRSRTAEMLDEAPTNQPIPTAYAAWEKHFIQHLLCVLQQSECR